MLNINKNTVISGGAQEGCSPPGGKVVEKNTKEETKVKIDLPLEF